MNNSVFGKEMENVRKHGDTKLVTRDKRRNQLVSEPIYHSRDKRRNQLVSEPIYHSTNWFSENLLPVEMKNIKVNMNKPVYLGLSIL